MIKTRLSLVPAGLLLGALAGCAAAAGPTAGAPAQPQAAPVAASPQPVTKAPEPPKTLAECRAAAATAPPSPATPAAGSAPAAGPVAETQRQFDQKMDALHETFRCCYDTLYAPTAPRKDGHVALLVKVDPAGKLTSAEILAEGTDVTSPEVHACILETARDLQYPKPAMDMDVGYQRVFDFKGRR